MSSLRRARLLSDLSQLQLCHLELGSEVLGGGTSHTPFEQLDESRELTRDEGREGEGEGASGQLRRVRSFSFLYAENERIRQERIEI